MNKLRLETFIRLWLVTSLKYLLEYALSDCTPPPLSPRTVESTDGNNRIYFDHDRTSFVMRVLLDNLGQVLRL